MAEQAGPSIVRPPTSRVRTTGTGLLLLCVALMPAPGARAESPPPPGASASPGSRPWMDRSLPPDRRAALLEQAMSERQRLLIVRGDYAVAAGILPPVNVVPPGAIGSAGFVPGIAALAIPALQETDGGIGVADPTDGETRRPARGPAGYATALPSGLATAATWSRDAAFRGGAMIGGEAHRLGFNVLLAGGVDLAREPRNGRTFEYAGEDPLLAGVITGEQVRGIQSQHVVATIKHWALNDQEAGRNSVSSDIDWAAARQSDLLAFELALDVGDPGAVMCAYNRVNGVHACGSDILLNRTLKHDWGFKGWVMSDWGAVHAATDANAGLDQESGSFFDQANGGRFFGAPLQAALRDGSVTLARLGDMARRILRSEFAHGLFDDPATPGAPLDAAADAAVARAVEQEAIVLLKNAGAVLPLSRRIASVAVIGSNAAAGVLEGGGSSVVWPIGGPAPPVDADIAFPRPLIWTPSSPLAAMRRAAPATRFAYDTGADPARAAAMAAKARVAIVFVNQWQTESVDAASLSLPADRQTGVDQDALVSAVAAANPNTIVVIESGGAVLMPWLHQVKGVLEAWYPGSGGGPAIADILFGAAGPSGRLPISFPASERQLPRPVLDVPTPGRADFRVNYDIEGAAVGYKWFQKRHLAPLFPFGYGLGYTSFAFSRLAVPSPDTPSVTFDVTNTGRRAGAVVPQLYLGLCGRGEAPERLIGFTRLHLQPGETRHVRIVGDPRLLAEFDGQSDRWVIKGGRYPFRLAASSADIVQTVTATLSSRTLAP